MLTHHIFLSALVFLHRGNSLKLTKLAVVSERDKNFFTNRVINIWNSLPDVIVTCSSVSSFKRNIVQIDLSEYLFFLKCSINSIWSFLVSLLIRKGTY